MSIIDNRAKVLLLIIDGIGDVTIPALSNRTPLEVAHTPYMDSVAASGLNGLIDPVEPGLACGSDTAHLSILGYDPRRYYRGRGAFESMGAGLDMNPGDIAFKSNFATINADTGIVEFRRADRNFEHLGPILCESLDGLPLPGYPEHHVAVRYATEHRCGVVVRGPGLSDAIQGTDPLKDGLPLLPVRPLDNSPEAAHTAAVVECVSREMQRVLRNHPINMRRTAQGLNPANAVLLRGCGARIQVPTFEEMHGMKAAVVAPTKIIAGLAMSLGMTPVEAPGATGAYNSDFASKARTAAECLARGGFDVVLLHVKAVDDAGHDRNLPLKVRLLEVVDVMLGHVLRHLWEAEQQRDGSFVVCITGDHSTPVEFGDHSNEPVPFAITHVRHAVQSLGGEGVLRRLHLGHIALPDMKNLPSLESLRQQGQQQHRRRLAAAGNQPFLLARGVEGGSGQFPDDASSDGSAEELGTWLEPWPQVAMGDTVRVFDELSAGYGALGRFPGRSVMPLISQFIGVEVLLNEVQEDSD